ncbi:peroxisomal membrane protein PEX13-like [Ylistrum balloti]|uniref:peroxisomal membrane protein PEX13-like n=1 Tax=Ylistrum balloti TaxID=509963 RepID=UPI0029059F0F|nr:peroxisomal membrane protein PEX13-like [Ylistrum balloti]
MAAPPKPWESPGVNRLQGSPVVPSNNMSGPGAPLPPCCTGPTATGSREPPPLPGRPSQQGMYGSRMSGLSGFGGGYGGMGYGSSYMSPYSSFGGGMYGSPYSSVGGYGMGYNRYGMNGPEDQYNGFARQAEESSRQAFQSVESIVNAFTSVSMMLDSTFQAVYNSFRAVLGVADNFSRLKMQLGHVFSALAVIRVIRYLYRRLLVLLRLRPAGYAEEAWTQASDTVEQLAAEAAKDPKKSSWPILVFFGIILGAPWLIWKFITRIADPSEGKKWATGEEDHFVARAEFDFKGESDEELSFTAGQNINIAPKELQPRMKGWLLASIDGKKSGIIPANYVKVLGKKRGTKYTQAAASESALAPVNPPPVAEPSIPKSAPQQGKSCCHSASKPVNMLESISENQSLEDVFQNDCNQDSMPNTDSSGANTTINDMSAEDILGGSTNNLE